MSTSSTPDLSTKPKDIQGYAFAPVCDLDHVTGYGKTELNISELDIITACSTCGRPARYQTILRKAEATWGKFVNIFNPESENYGWHQSHTYGICWNKAERVRSINIKE